MEQIWFIVKCIILGIIEGLTEFLPVSSTGHLIIGEKILGLDPSSPFMTSFSVIIQLGAILAVVYLFWPKILRKLSSFFRGEKEGRRFVLIWLLGCVPAAVLGLGLDDLIEEKLFSVPTVILALVIGALLLLGLERFFASRLHKRSTDEISNQDALVIGAWQCLALWPGFSRSAATIMGAWNRGLHSAPAAEYSFFLAIPVMFGASGLKLVKMDFSQILTHEYVALLLAFLTAFVTALLVVRAFMNFLRRHSLASFAYYRLGLAALMLVLLLARVI